jgi:hypothetical protein
MADNRTVNGTVTTEADGPARVAYDLMGRIVRTEEDVPKNREYYLRLYAQCRHLVSYPNRLDEVLKLNTK